MTLGSLGFVVLSQLFVQRARLEARMQSKASMLSGQMGMTRYMADLSSCSCLFNSLDPANPIRSHLKVNLGTVKSRQAAGKSGPSMELPKPLLIPTWKGKCNYAGADTFAEKGKFLNLLRRKSENLEDID